MPSDPLLAGPRGALPAPAGPAGGILLGIDIGGTKVAMGTVDDSGLPLRTARFPSDAEDGAPALLGRVVAAARDLAVASMRDRESPLAAVGIVCPGIIREVGVLLAPNNPGWDTVRLPGAVRAAFPGVPVGIMNDVKAAALAEITHGALAGVHCGIFVNLGTGLAAAIVLDGRVVDGATGAAGEIGYQIPGPVPGATLPPAYAQGHAPLEEAVSGSAIAQRVTRGLPSSAKAKDDLLPLLQDAQFFSDAAKALQG